MKANNEDEYLMLSGIQHFQFCKRQWALIHVEQQWEENVKTVEGQALHTKADQPFIREKRNNKLVVRSLPVKSRQLGASGICDVVEFVEDESGVPIQNSTKKYRPVPIEYKRGKPKQKDEDILQLAAQAICLEEMLLCSISVGYIYYNEIRHRVEIALSEDYKKRVRDIFNEMHYYYNNRHTPKVKTGNFCNSCSLQNICLPRLMNKESAKSYIERKISE